MSSRETSVNPHRLREQLQSIRTMLAHTLLSRLPVLNSCDRYYMKEFNLRTVKYNNVPVINISELDSYCKDTEKSFTLNFSFSTPQSTTILEQWHFCPEPIFDSQLLKKSMISTGLRLRTLVRSLISGCKLLPTFEAFNRLSKVANSKFECSLSLLEPNSNPYPTENFMFEIPNSILKIRVYYATNCDELIEKILHESELPRIKTTSNFSFKEIYDYVPSESIQIESSPKLKPIPIDHSKSEPVSIGLTRINPDEDLDFGFSSDDLKSKSDYFIGTTLLQSSQLSGSFGSPPFSDTLLTSRTPTEHSLFHQLSVSPFKDSPLAELAFTKPNNASTQSLPAASTLGNSLLSEMKSSYFLASTTSSISDSSSKLLKSSMMPQETSNHFTFIDTGFSADSLEDFAEMCSSQIIPNETSESILVPPSNSCESSGGSELDSSYLETLDSLESFASQYLS